MEERERESTVFEEEVCAFREGIYPDLLQQGKCESTAAQTYLNNEINTQLINLLLNLHKRCSSAGGLDFEEPCIHICT